MSETVFLPNPVVPPVAASKEMQDLLALVARFAKTNLSLFLCGEHGCGKSYLARYIHSLSLHNTHTFISLSAKDLFETDFLAQIQNQATLYISDFHFLSLECQKVFYQSISLENVRFIVASPHPIDEPMHCGVLLPELYAVLNVMPLFIPPLRNRKADIPLLADFFLCKYSKQYNKNFSGFAHSALSQLSDAYWEDNIVELETCIEQACKQEHPPLIEKINLHLNTSELSAILTSGDRTLRTAIEQFKREYISRILLETRWNQTETAKILDVQRTYLSRLIKELEIH